ncbi:MAG: hypothetical protein ACRD36_03000 [Candidatus Acidiferrum sp.]
MRAIDLIGFDAAISAPPASAGWHARPRALSPAMAAIHADMAAQAKETALAMVHDQARRYALKPRLLDALDPKSAKQLSELTPRQLRYRIAILIGVEVSTPRRLHGFGGEVPLINLKAAALYAERLIAIESTAPRSTP